VLEETPETLYLVIPAKPTGPLSNAQLEQVAAGHSHFTDPKVCLNA
jgi:hypothetical protein